MRTFDELVAEAESADVTGWGFGWLDGRATEERPPWGYSRLLAGRLARARSALDIDTGGGEVVSEAPALPGRMCVTEGWPPNLQRARELLGPRGVEVHEPREGGLLPFPDESFELVTARHPVRPDWPEIRRVLVPGGHYFAQHVGPASGFELIELLLGHLPEQRRGRDPKREVIAAEQAGLAVTDLRTARCRMELFDIGAVVWILRKCVWWVPDFSVDRYRDKLLEVDDLIRRRGAFVAHSTRHLIEAQRQTSSPAEGTSMSPLPDAASSEGPPGWAVRQAAEDLPEGSGESEVTALAWDLAHAAAERSNERHDEFDDPDEGGEA